MKQLYDYILESTVGNLGIDLDTFIGFVQNRDPRDPDYTTVYRDKIKEAFKARFKNKYVGILSAMENQLDMFLSDLSRMNVEPDELMLKFIYEKLCNTPDTKMDKFINTGMEASVYDLGDKVIKCFYNSHIPKDRLEFYKLCQTNKYKVLPRVYRIGKGYVILEKLKVHTQKCSTVIKELDKKIGSDTLYHIVQDGLVDRVKYHWSDIQRQAIQLMKDIREPLDELGFDPTNYGDLHVGNLGEREDGTIVYFDI